MKGSSRVYLLFEIHTSSVFFYPSDFVVLLDFLKLYYLYVYIHVHVGMYHSTHVEVTGQFWGVVSVSMWIVGIELMLFVTGL